MNVTNAVIDELRNALLGRPEVAFAYLFGSGACGPRHRLSDLDVAVQCHSDALDQHDDTRLETDLWVDIWGVVQRAVPGQDVDVVLLHRAPPLLADRVVRTGRLLFSRDEPMRIRWIVETKSRYCDTKPLRDMLDAVVARRIRTHRFGGASG